MFIYLACPYAHPDTTVRNYRYQTACRAAAKLMRDHVVFSPLSHSVPIAQIGKLPNDHDFWMAQDLPFVNYCDVMYVLCLDGWESSKGVQCEMSEMIKLRKHIVMIEESRIDDLPFVSPEALQFNSSHYNLCETI